MQPLALAFALALMGAALPSGALPGAATAAVGPAAGLGEAALVAFAAPRPGWRTAVLAQTELGFSARLALKALPAGPGQVHAQALPSPPRRVELALRLTQAAAATGSRLDPDAWSLSTQVASGAIEAWVPASAIAEGPTPSHPDHHELRFTGLAPASLRADEELSWRLDHPSGLRAKLSLRSR